MHNPIVADTQSDAAGRNFHGILEELGNARSTLQGQAMPKGW